MSDHIFYSEESDPTHTSDKEIPHPYTQLTSQERYIRRYFPKGCDFSAVSDEALALTVKKLNGRPRKCLDYWTPKHLPQAEPGALGM